MNKGLLFSGPFFSFAYMKVAVTKFLPGIMWVFVIFILLIMPGSDIPANEWFEILFFDKWIHTGLFAILVFLWALPLNTQVNRNVFLTVIIILSVLYGVAMEYVQKHIAPTRSFDITDMIADTAGALTGAVFTTIFYKRDKK